MAAGGKAYSAASDAIRRCGIRLRRPWDPSAFCVAVPGAVSRVGGGPSANVTFR